MKTSAYWREPLPVESKVDFAEMDLDDSVSIEASRLRMGLILTEQMESVAKIANKGLTRLPRWSGVVGEHDPLWESELEDEWMRSLTTAYYDGLLQFQRQMARQDRTEGRTPRPSEVVLWLLPEGRNALWASARAKSRALVDAQVSVLEPILQGARTPGGVRLMPLEAVEIQIRSAYGRWIGDASEALEFAEAAKRRMKIRDRAAFERWQRTRVPFSKRMQMTVDEYATYTAKATGKRKITPRMQEAYDRGALVADRTKSRAMAAHDAAGADPHVVSLTYSARREACPLCKRRDGVTRPKGDAWWALNTPPMHSSCGCDVVPATREERIPVTSKRDLAREVDDQDEVQPGYGTFDRKKVRSAKRIGARRATAKAKARASR